MKMLVAGAPRSWVLTTLRHSRLVRFATAPFGAARRSQHVTPRCPLSIGRRVH
jgi:hypothetical protein